jgi:hypothetical protein
MRYQMEQRCKIRPRNPEPPPLARGGRVTEDAFAAIAKPINDERSPLPLCSGKADTAVEIPEPSVGPQRIENRMQQDRSFETRLKGRVHRLVPIAESNIDQGNIGSDGRFSSRRASRALSILVASSFRPKMP